MSGTKGNDDCYFYFYSTCTKGDKCPFRHCEAALGKEVVCTLWKEGQCFRDNCQFRHMECKKNRSQIPCYWETQPGGCRKRHCVFLHMRPRSPNRSTFGEVPGAGYLGPAAQQTSHLSGQHMTGLPQGQPGMEEPSTAMDVPNITQPIEPVVVNFDDQESDTESTPTKHPLRERHSQLDCSVLSTQKAKKCVEFDVKTLEQIRLERIHKESPNFYETPDELEEDKQDVSSVDLRKHLKRKLGIMPLDDEIADNENQEFNELSTLEDKDEHADFHIKTLEEIRKEKVKKNGTDITVTTDLKIKSQENITQNHTSKKMRINRVVKLDTFPKPEIVSQKEETVMKNGSIKSVDNSTTDNAVLNQFSTFKRRIIKRKCEGASNIEGKVAKLQFDDTVSNCEKTVEQSIETCTDKKDEIVSCTSSNSNGIVAKDETNISVTTALDVQQLAVSSSSDPSAHISHLEEETIDEGSLVASKEKLALRKPREDRTASVTATEDDLDLFLDDDDAEDVSEDKSDDMLLQELEEIINS